jgi:tricorn protease
MRRVWVYWVARGGSAFTTNMQQTFRGHLAVLIDAYTYSDGETFAQGIKELKLGALIGERTAGAGVWLSDRNLQADHGIVRAAESAQFSIDGRWLVEGVGVTPDYVVANAPRATFGGADQQLSFAIDLLGKQIAAAPVTPLVRLHAPTGP